MTFVLRFAPSPTGLLHIGNARTAIMNWLFARKHGAHFILRFDDTDLERSKPEYIDAIRRDLAWLGLTYDQVESQSARLDRYREAAEKLKAAGRLYACYETPEELAFKRRRLLGQGKPPLYDRAALRLTDEEVAALKAEGRTPHWRFKLEAGSIHWHDMVRGDLSFEGANLGDPILIREDGSPVYILSSVVDDIEMNVTHVIRGEDHISNTAIQVQLMAALGADPARFSFGHTQLLLGEQGESLSKRIGSLSLEQLAQEGYEALALMSYLAKLGTSDDIAPALSLQQLIDDFDIKHVGKAAPRFIKDTLDRVNTRLLHHLPFEAIAPRLAEEGLATIDQKTWEMAHGNVQKLRDIKHFWDVCHQAVTPKIEERDYCARAAELLPDGPWTNDTWGAWTDALKAETGRKGRALFMPLRQALTGEDHGPEMKTILPMLGRERTLKRLCGETA